jgi:hypothetical protein
LRAGILVDSSSLRSSTSASCIFCTQPAISDSITFSPCSTSLSTLAGSAWASGVSACHQPITFSTSIAVWL